jgi:hypothetical protein
LTLSEEKLLNLVRIVDHAFSNRLGIIVLRQTVPLAIAKWLFIIVGIALLGWGYFEAQIAIAAATANLFDLSVAIDSMALSGLAIALSILALTSGNDWRNRENRVFADRIFNKLKNSTTDSIVLHQLIRMRMVLPKSVTLEQAHKANKDLFNEKELARRLFD